jgi:uncharacterized protein (TIGR03437 family)
MKVMKQIIRISILLAILFLSLHTTESYVFITGDGTPVGWNLINPQSPIVVNGRVTYSLNSAGSDNVPFNEVEQAITSAFQSWEDIPTSTIAFQRGPNNSSTSNIRNRFEIFWLEGSTITGDGANIAGALAVTFLEGIDNEITDAAIVFNGNQFTWATDGNPNDIDIEEVAAHEIGHSIGLDHSPNAAATMFPRTGRGRIQNRSLSQDETIAASVIYPTPDFSSSTGIINGRVLDNFGTPIFGAHIVAVDANGIAITGVLSLPDGTYSIQGLPPSNYTIYAQPLGSDFNPFFNLSALGPFYSEGIVINTNFQTSPDFPVVVNPGATTSLDFSVIRSVPAFESYLVLEAPGVFYRSVGSTLVQGQTDVFVGVAGPFLPQSGTPLTISGPGITIKQRFFETTTSGLWAIGAIVDVSPTAPIGPRNIIIDNGVQRTIVTGGVEIIPAPIVTSIVSQADYSPGVAPESLAVVFGSNLARATRPANSNPLPLSIAGTSITITDNTGARRSVPLMYVSPAQINIQIPPGTQPGPASLTLINGMGGTVTTPIDIQPVAPALFTADGTLNTSAANGFALRIRADGTSSYGPIARFDPSLGRFVAVPIDLGPPTDKVILGLYGTGFRFRSALPTVTIGGVSCQVIYAGPAGLGLDQLNVEIDKSLGGRGMVDIVMTVDGEQANTVAVNIGGPVAVPPTVTSVLSQADYSPRVAPESLAAAFGSNLATATAVATSNPPPTLLAGTSIAIRDSAGIERLAPLMYVSSNQVNFQMPAGTAPGPASFTLRNGTGGVSTTTIDILPAAIFTVGENIPSGFAYRIRADGTSSYEPIARFDPSLGRFVTVPIDLGPPTDKVILGVYGIGFRRGIPAATIGGVSCQVTYAGPTGSLAIEQMNILLPQSLIGVGLVNVEITIGGQPANTVAVNIGGSAP